MEVNLRIVTLVNVEVFFCATVKGGPSARQHGTAHVLLQVANFYVSFQSLVVKKMEAFPSFILKNSKFLR